MSLFYLSLKSACKKIEIKRNDTHFKIVIVYSRAQNGHRVNRKTIFFMEVSGLISIMCVQNSIE